MNLQNVTLAELRAKESDYRLRSERAMAERNAMSGGTSQTLMFNKSKTAAMWKERADDYALIIDLITQVTEPGSSSKQVDEHLVAGYRSVGGRLVRCLEHITAVEIGQTFLPMTAEEAAGQFCTFPVPGRVRGGSCGANLYEQFHSHGSSSVAAPAEGSGPECVTVGCSAGFCPGGPLCKAEDKSGDI